MAERRQIGPNPQELQQTQGESSQIVDTSSLENVQPKKPELSTLGKFNKSMEFLYISQAYIALGKKHNLPNEILLMINDHVNESNEHKPVKDIYWPRYLKHEIYVREKEKGKEWSAEKKETFLRSQNNMRYVQEQEDVIWSKEKEEKWLIAEEEQRQRDYEFDCMWMDESG